MKSRTLKVDYLARVEGEGAMRVRIKDDQVKDIQFKIFEPPRFFEAFLRGRDFREAPDITSRICGICPIAYELGASYAMEDICGIRVQGQLRALRRLVYNGEWIESHLLHAFMLHAPDFLGYDDVIAMARDHPQIVRDVLQMKKVGNSIIALLGGRSIHPINLRVGGFYRVPSRYDLRKLLDDIQWARDAAVASARFAASFSYPDFEQDYEFVALRHPDEYAVIEGRFVSNRGLDIPISDYDNHFSETHVPHSTALHSRVKERANCFVGPLARYNLNNGQLSPVASEVARDVGLGPECRNPFKSLLARMVEVVFALEEAKTIIEGYEEPERPAVAAKPRAGTGYGCTEAPRGICYHRYTLDKNGIITDAKIVPPTAVNQATIEKDLYGLVEENIDLPDDRLQYRCEQAIRNYDPCISCSAHFLKLNMERG